VQAVTAKLFERIALWSSARTTCGVVFQLRRAARGARGRDRGL